MSFLNWIVQVKRVAEEMATNIKSEFKLMLADLDWMDDGTRAQAKVGN